MKKFIHLNSSSIAIDCISSILKEQKDGFNTTIYYNVGSSSKSIQTSISYEEVIKRIEEISNKKRKQ